MEDCVKDVGDWAHVSERLKFDKPEFDEVAFRRVLPIVAPKIVALLHNLRNLDAADRKKHGHVFKHVVYIDTKSALYGAKNIAAALRAYGWKPIFGASYELEQTSASDAGTFGMLISPELYGKTLPVAFRKAQLDAFNKRPENVHGQQMQIMIIDMGYREGIDLFDVKYVHLLDKLMTAKDQTQAVGRAARYCGQKGLTFDPEEGWLLHVFRYDTRIPEELRKHYHADSLYELYVKTSGVPMQGLMFADTLEQVVIEGAVDADLTKNIHNFTLEDAEESDSDNETESESEVEEDLPVVPNMTIEQPNAQPRSWKNLFGLLGNNKQAAGANAEIDLPMIEIDTIDIPLNTKIADDYVLVKDIIASPAKPAPVPVKVPEVPAKPAPVPAKMPEVPAKPAPVPAKMPEALAKPAQIPAKMLEALAKPAQFPAKMPAAPAKPAQVSAKLPEVPAKPAQVLAKMPEAPAKPAPVLAKMPEASAKSAPVLVKMPEAPAKLAPVPVKMIEAPAKPAQVLAKVPAVPAKPAQVPAKVPAVPTKPAPVSEKPAQIPAKMPEAPAKPVQVPAKSPAVAEKTAKVPLKLPEVKITGTVPEVEVEEESYDMRPPTTMLSHAAMREYIGKHFAPFIWPPAKMENLCEISVNNAQPAYEEPPPDDETYSDILADAQREQKIPLAEDKDDAPPKQKIPLAEDDDEDDDEPYKSSAGAEKIAFTPTQEFVRHYFTPESPYKGILLFQSTGSGKTCCAVATATTSFEPAGYTILWATRLKLRNDMYKNIYDKTCHMKYRDNLSKIPADAMSYPLTYLSDRWIQPLSFKQFSNTVSGNNAVYRRLVERNGAEDPFRRTLLIIDEAHKLFAADMDIQEKPDTNIILRAIQNSYRISGKDSVRVMLMTATPYTSDPMDMIRLLNMLRPAESAFPETYDNFAEKYLNDNGQFTPRGKTEFLDGITGYVSYLNREKDAREFATPVFHDVYVPMTRSPKTKLIGALAELRKQIYNHERDIERVREARDRISAKIRADNAVLMQKCKGVLPSNREACEEQLTQSLKSYEQRLQEGVDEQEKGAQRKLIMAKAKESLLDNALKSRSSDVSQEGALEYRCGIPMASTFANAYNNEDEIIRADIPLPELMRTPDE